MPFRIETRGDYRQKLRKLAEHDLPQKRHEFIRRCMIQVLKKTVENNPVNTGRSRAAWVESLEQLGGKPHEGWQGATGLGVPEGRFLSFLDQHDGQDESSFLAVNAVFYTVFLEYGTEGRPTYQMAGRAIANLVNELQNDTVESLL